jgi:hypothetical protein
MCVEQEQDAQLSSTDVTSINSQAAMQVSDGSCSISSNQNLDTVVSDLVDTITMQLSFLDAIQAEWIATDNPAVFTLQIRRKLAAEMDMDPMHLHDEVRNHPKRSKAKPLVRHSHLDVSNVHKTSRQQLKPKSPMARDRISFKIQPRKSAMGVYHTMDVRSCCTAALSEYRRGAPAGKLVLQPRRSWRVPRLAWRSTQDYLRDFRSVGSLEPPWGRVGRIARHRPQASSGRPYRRRRGGGSTSCVAMELPRLACQEGCCYSYVYLCKGRGL